MDRIHNIDKKIWISKSSINLDELVRKRKNDEKFRDIVLIKEEEDIIYDDEENALLKLADEFSKTNGKQLDSQFTFDNVDERYLVRQTYPSVPKSYRIQLSHAKKLISDRAYRVNYLLDLNLTRREFLMRCLASNETLLMEEEKQAQGKTTVNLQQVSSQLGETDLCAILVIQIWPQPDKLRGVKLEKEVLFKIDQPLTDLRKQFKCQRDFGVPIDLSEMPEDADRIFNCEIFKSGFFLISDTFYNDMRDLNNLDLSRDIMLWASKDNPSSKEIPEGDISGTTSEFGPFKAAKMEETEFKDLTNFRLGCPYLYLHQGDCEHLFTISDIRYVVKDQKFQDTKYPVVTATTIGRKSTDFMRCYMCRNRSPHWFTRYNRRLPLDPFFFCESCFYSFNYDKNKKKIGEFKAYLYTSAFEIPDIVAMIDEHHAAVPE